MRSVGWVAVGVLWGAIGAVNGQDFKSEAGPDWRTRPVLSVVTNDQQVVSYVTNTVIELGGGMNRWDAASSKWVLAAPVLSITDSGVVGSGARHSVHFAPNINTASALEIQFPGDGGPERLRLQLLGLFYEAPGTNVLI